MYVCLISDMAYRMYLTNGSVSPQRNNSVTWRGGASRNHIGNNLQPCQRAGLCYQRNVSLAGVANVWHHDAARHAAGAPAGSIAPTMATTYQYGAVWRGVTIRLFAQRSSLSPA